jgi:hypothetical protein
MTPLVARTLAEAHLGWNRRHAGFTSDTERCYRLTIAPFPPGAIAEGSSSHQAKAYCIGHCEER